MQAERRARSAALERLVRDHDPTISSRQRALGVGALAVVGVALSVGGFLTDQAALTPAALFYQSLAPLGGGLVVAWLLRRHLLGTALNRRTVAAAVVSIGSLTASNALGWLAGMSVPHLLVCDSLVFALAAALHAVLLFRWVAFFPFVMLAAAVWAARFPDQAMRAFSLGSGVSLVASAWLAARASCAAKS